MDEQETSPAVENDTENKQVVPVAQVFHRFPTREEWNTMEIVAKTFINGGAMPKGIDTAPKMMVVLQAGREVGLSPIESLNSLYIVNGKVAMYGEAVPSQVMRAGHEIEWGECNAETATVTITRGDTGKSMTTTFTMQQAKERGYTSNPIYQKYPENMLKWRALSMTAKFICPDALKGIGIKEDIEVEVLDEGSKFHSKPEASRVKGELDAGTYNKRPLKDALKPKDADVESEPDFPCEEEGCDFTAKTKAGRTKHIKSAHGTK